MTIILETFFAKEWVEFDTVFPEVAEFEALSQMKKELTMIMKISHEDIQRELLEKSLAKEFVHCYSPLISDFDGQIIFEICSQICSIEVSNVTVNSPTY